jgi:predicted glycogen debranching enzyme
VAQEAACGILRRVLKPLGPDILADLDRASRLEWLESNGRGGFASSTVVGANTRRYHSLLTAALDPPVRRHVLLSRVEEIVDDGTTRIELGCNFYPGSTHPEGYKRQSGFRLDPFPIFTWDAGDRRLEKAVFLLHGEDTAVIRYSLLRGSPCSLRVRPFLAFRDYHGLARVDASLDPIVKISGGVASVKPYATLPELFFHQNAREIAVRGNWWRSHLYPREKERGLPFEEDLFSPFEMRFELTSRAPILLVVSTSRMLKMEPLRLEPHERGRRAAVIAGARRTAPSLDDTLCLAADNYLVRRGAGAGAASATAVTGSFAAAGAVGGTSVIAGYPWFTDWGRDTMISLPGLCLATGRTTEARDILATFAAYVDQGMIPNRFPDSGEAPEYNNVDGTLWFVHAVGRYLAKTGDVTAGEQIFLPKLLQIVEQHRKGTRHGIRVTEDGLLSGGEPGVQLTWMDAKLGDWVVTPRSGKPVEINALWIEALETVAELCKRLGRVADAADCAASAALARESFAKRFWYEEGGYLFDVVDTPEGRDDPSLRPNQIIAASLPHPAITGDRARAVVEVVRRELLTPYGLRTLAPKDPRYQRRYDGDLRMRDGAYHQGTVWPWLLGPFVRAFLRVEAKTPARVAEARAMLDPLIAHLADYGLGHVAEVFDGDAPHEPRGCFAQAWSTAELIALLVDELA